MMCAEPNCKGHLRVTHTYTREQQKFQRAVCMKCGSIHRISSQATLVAARGDGAKAHAARAQKLCETRS